MTPRRTKILISPVWNGIWKIWEIFFKLMQIETQCNQKFFHNFFFFFFWALEWNIDFWTIKSKPQIYKINKNVFNDTWSINIPLEMTLFFSNMVWFCSILVLAFWLSRWQHTLTHFSPMLHLYTPWKRQGV